MARLKDVLNKIHAVKKTKQITKAMNMVAASRLRGAQSKMEAFRPYANKFSEVLGSLAARSGEEANTLLVPRDNVKKIHLLLCTSDRGLCGGFNANLIQKANKFTKKKVEDGAEVTFTAFGKKGRDWCRASQQAIAEDSQYALAYAGHLMPIPESMSFAEAACVSETYITAYLNIFLMISISMTCI